MGKCRNKDKEKAILRYGNEIASLWGGSCFDYDMDTKAGEVTYMCIEHGEKFAVTEKLIDVPGYKSK